MNSRTKGSRNEKKCIDELREEGWLVDRVEKKGKFLKEKDLFGLFDLVALKGNVTRFIQVTTNRPHNHEDYQAFANAWQHGMREVYQYVWYDRAGWVLFEYKKGMSKRKEDLRK